MKIHKLNIRFVIAKNKTRANGTAPLFCRITYLEKRKQFATGYFVKPKEWFNKLQIVKPPNKENDFINTQLSLIKQNVSQAFLFLQVNQQEFSVIDIYKQYKGETITKEYGVVEMYELLCKRLEKLIAVELEKQTHDKYLESGKHLKNYLKWQFKAKDIQLKELKYSFITNYGYYLKTEKKLQQSTINKAIQRFKRSITYAVSEEYLANDPFALYKAKRVKKELIYLTVDELKRLEKYSFTIKRVEQIKDLFILCCYTGLGFNEMTNLKLEHLAKEFDGNLWLNIPRGKTKKSYKIPLLPKALELIEKYKGIDNTYLLPRISNQKFNSYLKEIANIVGIDKKLTHHVARKTFATTVLLYNNVPMEIVSELLGHSKLDTTQKHYAKVVKTRVSEEIKKIIQKKRSH